MIILNLVGIAQTNQTIDLKAFHSISSHDLLEYAAELSADKYRGRMSGSPGYEAAAEWVANLVKDWGLKPEIGRASCRVTV